MNIKLGLISMISMGIMMNFQAWVEKPSFQIPEMGLLAIKSNSLVASSFLPEPKVVKTLDVLATAYSSTPEETDDDPFVTASGTMVKDGIIANNLLPFGTKIRIPELYGDKIFVVEDRMNSRKSAYQIDIWFASKAQAKEFGAKQTYIEVLES